MPYCTYCGYYFRGHGGHCSQHDPIFFPEDLNRYSLDAYTTQPARIRYRTGHGRRPKPHKKVYDSYHDTLELGYKPSNDHSLAPINHSTSNHHLDSITAAATLERLTDKHCVDTLAFHIHPDGTRSISVEPNKDREQCPTCRKWFPDRRHLELHCWQFPSGCEIHGMCFAKEDEHWHGTSENHDRCFVRGCGSIYRREGGWKAVAVEQHVREWHWH